MIQVDIDGDILGANKPAGARGAGRREGCSCAALAAGTRGARATARASSAPAQGREVRRHAMRARARQARREARRPGVPMNSAHVAQRLPAGLPRRRDRSSPTAATPPSGRSSSTRCACPTRCSRPSRSACSARAWRRRWARRSRVPGSRSAASSATARWASTRRRSRPRCATACASIYLVLCDKQWGMVKMNQQFALKPLKTLIRKSLGPDETINADLGEIALRQARPQSMGAHGERVADPRGLRGAIERSLASGGPAVIHVDVDPVKHMWAPGPDALQGHAPGAQGEMNAIDAVRLNFSPESLVVLDVILAFVLFGVALDIRVADFKGIVTAPRGTLIGLLAHSVLLPAVAYVLTLVLRPVPSIALGMILVASCPSGNISNFLVNYGRGNTALSVTIAAFSMLGSIFFTPFNIAFWGGLNPATRPILTAVALEPVAGARHDRPAARRADRARRLGRQPLAGVCTARTRPFPCALARVLRPVRRRRARGQLGLLPAVRRPRGVVRVHAECVRAAHGLLHRARGPAAGGRPPRRRARGRHPELGFRPRARLQFLRRAGRHGDRRGLVGHLAHPGRPRARDLVAAASPEGMPAGATA